MDARTFLNGSTLFVAVLLLGLPWAFAPTLATQITVSALGALSVSFLLGAVGLLSFGQGLFVGLGAYTTGLLLRDFEWAPVPTIVAATLAGMLVASVLGSIIVRRQGVYFVMLTMAFAQMGYFAMLAFKDVTGGENGLTGVPRNLIILNVELDEPMAMYRVAAVLFFLVFLFTQRLLASPLGSVLESIKQNEARSEAIGYPVARYKIFALSIAGGMAGLAGAIHVISLGFVSPNNIELEMSQRLLVIGVVGGISSPGGALLGAVFFECMSHILSEIWPRWLSLIAILLIGITLYVPGGIWALGTRFLSLAKRHAGK